MKTCNVNHKEKCLQAKSKKVLHNHIKKKLQTRHSIPPLKSPSGELCLDPKIKANLLNKTFSEVFLTDNDPNLPKVHSKEHIDIPSILEYVSPFNISTAINNLKKSVSRTPDFVPSYYIKMTSLQLLKPLTIIFNYSLQTSQVPKLWKKAIVVPIFKKGKKNDTKNYRPISLTSIFCRLLERIIHNQISSHLQNNSIITIAQHGFMKKRSTQTQQIKFLDILTSHYELNQHLDVIYLDFSKAFDKVSHKKLLHVLKHIKLHTGLINWIGNYLSERTQITAVGASCSNQISITSGVPQGSVLGPLLFIIYLQDLINIIHHECTETTVFAFADDVKLLSSKPHDLQKALNIVGEWTNDWKLLLNTNKSDHFTIKQKATTDFNINAEIIPKVDEVRDLGIILSNDFKWSKHIDKARTKANILGHALVRSFLPHNTHLLVNLYKTYIRPILEYNTCTWSPFLKAEIDRVESVQRKFTRTLCQRANIKFSSYSDRLQQLKLESLQSRRIKNDLIFLYKILNNLIDIQFSDYFEFSNFSGHNLRRHNLHLDRKRPAKTLCRQNFFSMRVIGYWNKLPTNIVTSPTLGIFKHRLKSISYPF